MKPRVKFLTVVWGRDYIRRFCNLSLPSFMAQGNLPALAAATDLEVLIMTCRADFACFEDYPAFHRLRETCSVRFVEIDDLVYNTVIYGITLTLAYARPIIACGEDMVNIHFVFMNADFVLGDGSLRSLIKPISDGRSIVLGPSFRAISEDVEPLLQQKVDTTLGILSLPCREMVRMALPHPHRTTVAKIRNQQSIHSSHPNQFFWQVDEQTLLGRYFLIFMLSLKPERVIRTINSYCDYGFIPEMCPSGDELAIGDSDDFFMLELQERDKESNLLSFGSQSTKQIARSLSEWTTLEHRRAAQYDIVFHSESLQNNLHLFKTEANHFINELTEHLGPVHNHAFHRYWSPGVMAWLSHRVLPAPPPELEPLPRTLLFRWLEINHNAVTFLRESGCWADYKFLENQIAKLTCYNSEVLLLGEPSRLLGLILAQRLRHGSAEADEHDNKAIFQGFPTPQKQYSKCIAFLENVNRDKLVQTLKSAIAHSANYADILLIIHPEEPLLESPHQIRDILAAQLRSWKLAEGLALEMSSIGTPAFWRSRHLAKKVARYFKSSRFPLSIRRVRHLFKSLPLVLLNIYILWRTKSRTTTDHGVIMWHQKGLATTDNEARISATSIAFTFRVQKHSRESGTLSFE